MTPQTQQWAKNDVSVRVQGYLGSGTTRVTFHAKDLKSGKKLVVKINKDRSKHQFYDYAQDVNLQKLSEKYARQYNQTLQQNLVHYVETVIGETDRGEFLLLEPLLKGFKKYNNNYGYSNDSDDWGKIAQSFTHFTHMVSGGAVMICDIQGYGGELTDPGLHSLDGQGGSCDLGNQGMQKFFQSHRCNKFCFQFLRALNPYPAYGQAAQ